MRTIYHIIMIVEAIALILVIFLLFKKIRQRNAASKEMLIIEVILFAINIIQLPLELYMGTTSVHSYLAPCIWFINCVLEAYNLNMSKR